jgi:tetrahydromethanopterin S-methyltransferase subunit A
MKPAPDLKKRKRMSSEAGTRKRAKKSDAQDSVVPDTSPAPVVQEQNVKTELPVADISTETKEDTSKDEPVVQEKPQIVEIADDEEDEEEKEEIICEPGPEEENQPDELNSTNEGA